MNILVILSHPSYESSIANKTIIDECKKAKTNITVRHLDALYHDYTINVEEEQSALLLADIIILQFPFYWYSVPASLKNWIDKVLTFNFAYGPEGDKLNGKQLIISTTIGGPEVSYSPLGYNHFRVEDLLKPLEQTAYLAKMSYCQPIYTYSCVYIPGVYNKEEEVIARAKTHAKRLINSLDSIIKQINN